MDEESRNPAVTEPVFAFYGLKFRVYDLKFFSDVPHMGINSVVGDQALHGCVH